MTEWNLRHRDEPEAAPASQTRVAPGKRSLTQSIPPRSTEAPEAHGAQAAGLGYIGGASRLQAPSTPPDDPFGLHLQGGASPSQPSGEAAVAARQAGLGDVASVRLHTDASAAAAAEALDARAFTVGSDVYFGAGEYRPDTRDGARLLGHELAHTSQQRGLGTPALAAKLRTTESGDRTEDEADRAGDAFASALGGGPIVPVALSAAPVAIARSKRGAPGAPSSGGVDRDVAPLPFGQSRPLDPLGQSRPAPAFGQSFLDPARDADNDGQADLFVRPGAAPSRRAASTGPSKHAARLARDAQAAIVDVNLIPSTLLPAYASARDALDPGALQAIAADMLGKYQDAVGVRDQIQPIVDPATAGHAAHAALPETPESLADRAVLGPALAGLEAALAVAESRLASGLGPTRFQGHDLSGGVAPVRIARHAHLTVPRLLREAINTGELVAAVAEIRDLLPGAALATMSATSMPMDADTARAIADRLAPFASRPVHFAFIKSALAKLGLWAQVEHATSSEGRSLGQIDQRATAQAERFGAGADLGRYDADRVIGLLKPKSIGPDETRYEVTASSAAKIVEAVGEIEDPDGRSAALKDLDARGVLDAIAELAPPAHVQRLHDGLPPTGAAHVKSLMRRHFQGRDTTDNSLGAMLGDGILHSAGNLLTFGFLDEHDAAYRQMKAGEITEADYRQATRKALLRAGVVGAASYATGGAAGSYAAGLTASLAARGIAGRVAANTLTGAAAGSASAVGGRVGSDAVSGEVSSTGDYGRDALLGGAIGGGLGAGLTTVGAAGAKFLPEGVKTPLHRLAERFPSLADDAEVFGAFQRLGVQHSKGVVTFTIGARRLARLAGDGAITATAEVMAAVRKAIAGARAGLAHAADDLSGGFGPQLAGAGAYGDVRLSVTAKAARPLHEPGPLDGPAVTIVKAERLGDDLVSRPGDDVGNYLGDGPESTGMQVVDMADDAASQRGANAAATRSPTAGSRTPLAEHIPAPGPAFVDWFDGLTLKELDTLLRDTNKGGRIGARKVIEDNVRHPGGLHEWLMVKHVRKVKEWGISLQTVLDARTATAATVGRTFRHKRLDGRTGAGPGSGTMHRQLDRMLTESGSLNEFRRRLNQWADAEMYPVPGPNGEAPLGRYYLPAELQLPAEGAAR